MTETIGNPLSWGVGALRGAGRGIEAVTAEIASHDTAVPRVRRIDYEDLRDCLRLGWQDFLACRSDVAALCLLYPIIGIAMAYVALKGELLPLAFPIVSGFALVGPAAAVGLYEMSRLRERGQEPSWADAFAVAGSPSFGAIFALAVMLGVTFLVWLLVANGIYVITLGPDAPVSLGSFLTEALTTPAGWAMTIVGIAVGGLFATLVLATSVVSFPLLIDRHVGLPVAVVTSIRVAEENPGPIAVWGLIVAVLLALGSLPAFLGLLVVLPVLGHATWHLYRRAVV
ncbi:DUF2189 domain-containing protein [Amaricoccus sp.]|uniref:DUF2189 domain-containing protein n=1 Tax=Amaricoccus sp. TaxID=1872485 RepID=UPI001B5482F1|nr:DUF2189 domain-containing protein [Amaricoccus sp.]MBP7001904.1 DUF2189 domain-containing protein [Amaricoccus sp.]